MWQGKSSTAPTSAPAGGDAAGDGEGRAAPGDSEAARPASATQANSKEKTPMCLVNELARYNKVRNAREISTYPYLAPLAVIA